MPTRGGNATLDDYKAVLDELSEIIEKYRSTYDIIIGGDMNASLHRSDRNTSGKGSITFCSLFLKHIATPACPLLLSSGS
jgi:hypothetical protein